MSRRRYLVAYDIRDPKRLRAVHSAMKSFGYPLQYSVFVCDLDGVERVSLKSRVGELIDHAGDSVAIIDLGDVASRGVDCFDFLGILPTLPRDGPQIV